MVCVCERGSCDNLQRETRENFLNMIQNKSMDFSQYSDKQEMSLECFSPKINDRSLQKNYLSPDKKRRDFYRL